MSVLLRGRPENGSPSPCRPDSGWGNSAVLIVRLTVRSRCNIDQYNKRRSFICGETAAQETFTVNSDQVRQRAERIFKKAERARDGREAMTEYEAGARATREKTARLKALRLDRDARAIELQSIIAL